MIGRGVGLARPGGGVQHRLLGAGSSKTAEHQQGYSSGVWLLGVA